MKAKHLLLALLVFFSFNSICQAQIIVLTILSIAKSVQPADKKLMTNIKGEWIFKEAEIDNKDVMGDFGEIKIYFPKCPGKDKKAGNCQAIYVANDDRMDYFKSLLGDDNKIAITSRKEINKAAKQEDEQYEKVKYELVKAKGVDYEFSFKYKKGTLVIETTGSDHSEYFLLTRPTNKKKKK